LYFNPIRTLSFLSTVSNFQLNKLTRDPIALKLNSTNQQLMSRAPLDLITVSVTVHASVSKAWNYYTNPIHITGWNFASDDWCCPWAKNDLQVGGLFSSRMEARDGSEGFEFGGYYTEVQTETMTKYIMGDPSKISDTDRIAEVRFEKLGENETKVTVEFQPETENPIEMQQGGWQSVLDNYKKYVERINETEITIKARAEKVWKAITTSQGVESYLPGMKVVSSWNVGSEVEYTCYNKDGSIMMWNDNEMIWKGVITELAPNKRYVVEYNGSTGIEKEIYELSEENDGTTKLIFVQTATTPEVAKNYEDGNQESLQLLKNYLEK
jgi:uncharacterized protein YndB with AHSA1/START domain